MLLIGADMRADPKDYFRIQVVDEQTGRGVPLVQLRAVNEASWWTDSNGIIAFDEPGLFDRKVFFHVKSHGYEYPKDGFGYRGLALKPVRGGNAIVKVKRLNIAERLYRVTGAGIYRDSLLTGQATPSRQPLLNGEVLGQDTVIVTPYRGKLFWFWGDTERATYPLGNFSASGATSELPGAGGLDPGRGVNLSYFVNQEGFSKGMCPLPGKGLRWIEGLMTVRDERGDERLLARLANVRDLGHVNDWHLMIFNDQRQEFESIVRWDTREGHDSAHPFQASVDGVEYYYLYPNYRVKADLASFKDLTRYEAFTCVAGDGKLRGRETQIERDANGLPVYRWLAGADRLHAGRARDLVASGVLKREESWQPLRDFETGARVEVGRGSTFWNEYRRRWILIGSGKAGEVWFAEADTPTGPWGYARRLVSHDQYNFYNPTQHPYFDQAGGKLVYFEGTYTAEFSGAREKTPRYNYNQIMYRLALDDERLRLPVPIYRIRSTDGAESLMTGEAVTAAKAWAKVHAAPFFAIPPGRSGNGLVAVSAAGHAEFRLEVGGAKTDRSLFLALPAESDSKTPAPEYKTEALIPLYEFRRPTDGRCFYSTQTDDAPAGFERAAKPLCRVWSNSGTAWTLDPAPQPRSMSLGESNASTRNQQGKQP